MRGRPRKPTAQHVADGTHRADRTNAREPQFALGAPPKPDHVAQNVDASLEWDRIVPMLVDQRILSAAHGAAVAAYCSSYADVVIYERIKNGDDFAPFVAETTVDGAGQEHQRLRAHPIVAMTIDARKELRQWASQLGITPASSPKVSTRRDDTGPTPFAVYLADHKRA